MTAADTRGNWLPDTPADEDAPEQKRTVPLWVLGSYGLGGLMVLAGLAFALLRGNRHAIACLIVGPVLLAITIVIARRLARIEKDAQYVGIITAALILKFAGALARYYVAFIVYKGNDAKEYDTYGRYLAPHIRHGSVPDVGTALGTGFMHYLTGFVYAIFGSSIISGFLVFSWLSFIGMLFFWRAFRRAVPGGDGKRYLLLVLLVPSLLYWPSSIGKEAWMLLWLGVAAYAVSRILTNKIGTGILILLPALGACMVVRPHLALLVFIALGFAGLIRPPRGRSPLVTIALMAVLVVAGLGILSSTKSFFGVQSLTQESVTSTLDQASSQTSEGGSSFSPVRVHTGLEMPWATVTVLFRPLPIEAHNLAGGIAALEGVALMGLTVVSWRRVVNLRYIKESSYVAFALAYVLVFVFAFSAFSNFGILARQRTQVLPLYLVLLALPQIPKRKPKSYDDLVATPEALPAGDQHAVG